MSILLQLRDMSVRLQDIRNRAIEEEKESDDVEFEEGGVKIVSSLFYSDRKSARRALDFDGYPFATEIETVPWNIFQNITVSYWVWVDLPLAKVEALIDKTGLPDTELSPMEEFYPTENGPSRWNAHARSLDAVLALWRVWEREQYGSPFAVQTMGEDVQT